MQGDTTGFEGSGVAVAAGIAAASSLVGLMAGVLIGYGMGRRASLPQKVSGPKRSGPMPGSYAAIQAEAARGWR